jgi:DNA-binding MarR family transcriptional regulator
VSSAIQQIYSPAVGRPSDTDTTRLIQCIELVLERLVPPRRPQDRDLPDCSLREFHALRVLGAKGRIRMSELAAALDVPVSTASRTVDRLAAKDLVRRVAVKDDGRAVHVAFSRRGGAIHRYISRSRHAAAAAMLAPLSEAERRRLLAALARIVAEDERITLRKQQSKSNDQK